MLAHRRRLVETATVKNLGACGWSRRIVHIIQELTVRNHDVSRGIPARHTGKLTALSVTALATALLSAAPRPPGHGAVGVTGPLVDQSVTRTGRSAVTTTPFSISSAGETLLAFVAADGPASGGQAATVSGAGLRWRLLRRADGRPGDAEIWTATSRSRQRAVTVTSTLRRRPFDEQLTVLAISRAGGIGATAAASGGSGSPRVTLPATKTRAYVYAVGNDWDSARGRSPGAGQLLVSQWVDRAAGDTFWVQHAAVAGRVSARPVTLDDVAPSDDQWNLAAVEVLARS
jgi:hypothetical protein